MSEITLNKPASPPANGAEQRDAHRFYNSSILLTRVMLAGTPTSYFAWVHDVSETGAGLDVLGPIGAGIDIVFELKGTGEYEKIRLRAQVIHATPVGPFYRLGCRFTLPLRPTVLAALKHKMRRPE